MPLRRSLCLLWAAAGLYGQDAAALKTILERLDRLEQENKELRAEVEKLRERVGLAAPAGESRERLDILQQRVEEQAQTKVETSQKFPLRVTGMALFNVFHNGPNSGGQDVPVTASAQRSGAVAGATFRQSIIGLDFSGPRTFLGGSVRGSLVMDFFDGLTEPQYNPLRIRIASLSLDWKTRSITAGYEKAIFNPREPTSLMMVGISPMTGTGNLWRWQPQVRFEQRVRLSGTTGLRAQAGVLQTSEEYGGDYDGIPFERRRPGLEGRFELVHRMNEDRRIEVAPGFHFSQSHIEHQSIPSRLVSFDWFFNPWRRIEWSGAFFYGENTAHLGGLRQGFNYYDDRVTPVHATGGWSQITLIATPRLSFHVMAGQEDDRNSDLSGSGVGKNLAAGGNVMYRIAPNVILSFEGLHYRTTWIGAGVRDNNRYDLALAYLF